MVTQAKLDEPGVSPIKGEEQILVDRLVLRAEEKPRLVESIETAYRLSDGLALVGWYVPSRNGAAIASE